MCTSWTAALCWCVFRCQATIFFANLLSVISHHLDLKTMCGDFFSPGNAAGTKILQAKTSPCGSRAVHL